MATRISKLLKRDVAAILEGRTLGRPANVLIDPDHQRIAAVVLVATQIPELSVAVRSSAILSFGTDTIAIEAMSHSESPHTTSSCSACSPTEATFAAASC